MRRNEPVEIISIFVPILVRAAVAVLAFGVMALGIVVLSGLVEFPS